MVEKLDNKTIIKTTSYSQEEILNNIIELHCPEGFEVDPTYSRGRFYSGSVPKPKFKFDINPLSEDVQQADCRNLPFLDNSINSIVFDPPFIVGKYKNKKPTGIITKSFGYYKTIKKLWEMYQKAITEFHRILKNEGVLVFKCQDTISGGRQYLSHVEIINYAIHIGFYPKDLFVLLAKTRIIGKNHHKQQHARKFHSYFLVFIKKETPVKYFPMKKRKEGN